MLAVLLDLEIVTLGKETRAPKDLEWQGDIHTDRTGMLEAQVKRYVQLRLEEALGTPFPFVSPMLE